MDLIITLMVLLMLLKCLMVTLLLDGLVLNNISRQLFLLSLINKEMEFINNV